MDEDVSIKMPSSSDCCREFLTKKERIAIVAIDLAGERGWETLSLTDVAYRAGLSVAEIASLFDEKNDLLRVYMRKVDQQMLLGFPVAKEGGHDENPHDRLFDMMMARIDCLSEHREGVVAVLRSFKFDPREILSLVPDISRACRWMLESAEVSTTGIKGLARIIGLASIYINTLRVWADDESPDLSKTMAALDKSLARAASLSSTLGLL